jgi:hypothetical protein
VGRAIDERDENADEEDEKVVRRRERRRRSRGDLIENVNIGTIIQGSLYKLGLLGKRNAKKRCLSVLIPRHSTPSQ